MKFKSFEESSSENQKVNQIVSGIAVSEIRNESNN